MPRYQFDKWSELYAERVGSLKSSAVRDLLSVTARPDIISLAGGLPYTNDFRMEKVVSAVRETMLKEGSAALQYGPTEGHVGLKEHIVKLMAVDGIKVDVDDLVVTDGSQQGLDLLAKVFIDPGDTILVEAPSYVGAINAFEAYQPKMVGIPLDAEGIIVERLAETLAQLKKEGKRAKFLYLIPNFHNPAGVTLSLERRHKLIDLAREYELLLVEDNPYGRLRFEGEDVPSLRALDESVVYLGTFSKIFSPGVRLGWVTAPTPILEKIICGKQSADLCTSSFTQRLVEHFFSANDLGEYLDSLITLYRSRRDAMLESLSEYFPPEAAWNRPQGGFFVWVELPPFVDTTEMLAEAISKKVAYVAGRAFYPDGSGQNFMRLAFCYPKEEDIREGIRRLAGVVKNQLALYHSVADRLKKPPNVKN